MSAEEYFGDWMKVIDKAELIKIMKWLKTVDKTVLCPSINNVFKAFRLCPYNDCIVCMIGLDPYPQKGVATGILFGNSADTPEELLSPSLQAVKESVINYEFPHYQLEFDNTLESWAKQGILMLNSALTCLVNQIGIHTEIWRPFIAKLLYNMSTKNTGIIYVLFGRQAQSFRKYIINSPKVFEYYHPAYYARNGTKMPYNTFPDINGELKKLYNYKIEFYKDGTI